MKTAEKQLHAALLHTFFELYDAKDLAKDCAKALDLELHAAKSSSFSLRHSKDDEVKDADLTKAIVKSMRDLMDERLSEATDIMADSYDLVFDSDKITDKLVDALFDIVHDGRIIYVDIDV